MIKSKTSLTREMKARIREDLQGRYSETELVNFLNTCSFLVAYFKSSTIVPASDQGASVPRLSTKQPLAPTWQVRHHYLWCFHLSSYKVFTYTVT